MNCEQIKEYIPDYLTGQIDPRLVERIEKHLEKCGECADELARINFAFEGLNSLPEETPGTELTSQFYYTLEAYKEGLEENRKSNRWLEYLWPQKPVFRIAFTAIVLFIGLVIGYNIKKDNVTDNELAYLGSEIKGVKQLVSMSLLRQPSTSERLKGVNLSAEISQPSDQLISALFTTLNTDPNINVRLASVDALGLFSEFRGVREKLIVSLSEQSSPLVQVALIDLLFLIREKKALRALRRLVDEENIDVSVKQHARTVIKEMI